MRQMNISQFKAQCHSLLRELDSDGLMITRLGKSVATLVPVPGSCADLIGSMKGKILIKGDTLGSGLNWNANR
jgi:antitoxin (DNA-binding transcriptional repressor) of toxin-antitoxin stability system